MSEAARSRSPAGSVSALRLLAWPGSRKEREDQCVEAWAAVARPSAASRARLGRLEHLGAMVTAGALPVSRQEPGNGTRSSAEHRCRQLRKVAAVSARPRLVTTALGHRAARIQDNK